MSRSFLVIQHFRLFRLLSAIFSNSLNLKSNVLKMLAKKAVINTLLKKNASLSIIQGATYSSGGMFNERAPIGKREWVGFGINGGPHYADRPDFPLPAVRFREITGELVALREKEKGDWKNLTIEEKKKLYRTSFRQTLVEKEAPTGEWKMILGWTLVTISLGLLTFSTVESMIYKPFPPTFSEEHRAASLRKMLDLKTGHITGISSKWDYEKDDWKK